jgi:hypothetical protein
MISDSYEALSLENCHAAGGNYGFSLAWILSVNHGASYEKQKGVSNSFSNKLRIGGVLFVRNIGFDVQ